MEFEIFIKDNAFLPISVDIKTGTAVVFINTDAVRHEIHCKGHANFPLLSMNPGEFRHHVFSLPGRYEISENGIGDMKVRAPRYHGILTSSSYCSLFFILVRGGSDRDRQGKHTEAQLLPDQ